MSPRNYTRRDLKHPGLSDPQEIVRVFERYDWHSRMAGTAMGITGKAALAVLKKLRPEVYEAKRAEGMFDRGRSRL